MKAKPPKPKMCEICRETFQPRAMGQKVCGVDCSIERLKRKQVAAAVKPYMPKRSKETKARKTHRQNDRPHQLKLTQATVNKYVVYVQEAGKPCYTCGKEFNGNKKGGVIDCGHWLTRGAHPEKALDTRQMRRQCIPCNRYNGGRPDVFESNLVKELGQHEVDEIRRSKPTKLTSADLAEKRKHYAKLIREAGI